MGAPSQRWDPEQYDRDARFVSDLGEPVVDLLAPRTGERLLDLGCGHGTLSARLAAGGAEVVGVDASPEQVWAALQRGIDARIVDATELPFDAEFDGVFSNAVLHWIPDADRVIDGVWRALRPGGRFVAEFGGAGNVAAVRAAVTGPLADRGLDASSLMPWYFPTPDEYRTRLETRGLRVDTLLHFPRPTPFPAGIGRWLEIFGQAYLDPIPADDRAQFVGEVDGALPEGARSTEGTLVIDYVRLRVAATKPG